MVLLARQFARIARTSAARQRATLGKLGAAQGRALLPKGACAAPVPAAWAMRARTFHSNSALREEETQEEDAMPEAEERVVD